jgi:RNA polymerase sigma factor (sigma-70 family)
MTDSVMGTLLVDVGERARKYAERIVDPQTADDIAQDVVLTALTRMRAGRWRPGRGGIDGYVRCVVRRRAGDALKRRQRRHEREAEHARELTEGVHAWMDPELALEARELDTMYARATAGLPETHRRAYQLVRVQHASHATAAAVLGVTPSALSMNVVRAQQALEVELELRGIEAPKGRRKSRVREPQA